MMDKKKSILNTLFLILIFGITLYYIFHGQDMEELSHYIAMSDVRFWFVAMVFVILFILSESVIIYYMMKSVGQKAKLSHCFLYSFVGFFFSCITPSATGGQPAQIYFMHKDKLSIPISTLILMLVTITYKFVLVVLGVAILILRPASIMPYLAPVMGWMYLGVGLNVFCVSFMMLIVFHPTMARTFLIGMVQGLHKIHLLKHPERKISKIEKAMEQYEGVAAYFATHKRVVFNVLLITMVQRFLLFFVTALVFWSFGLKGLDWFSITSLQGMISVAVDMLPLPGGMGISESLFLRIFETLFRELTLAGMVVSRGLSYYTELIFSAIFTVVAFLTIGRKKE